MKKFLGIIAVAGILASCTNSGSNDQRVKDSTDSVTRADSMTKANAMAKPSAPAVDSNMNKMTGDSGMTKMSGDTSKMK